MSGRAHSPLSACVHSGWWSQFRGENSGRGGELDIKSVIVVAMSA